LEWFLANNSFFDGKKRSFTEHKWIGQNDITSQGMIGTLSTHVTKGSLAQGCQGSSVSAELAFHADDGD